MKTFLLLASAVLFAFAYPSATPGVDPVNPYAGKPIPQKQFETSCDFIDFMRAQVVKDTLAWFKQALGNRNNSFIHITIRDLAGFEQVAGMIRRTGEGAYQVILQAPKAKINEIKDRLLDKRCTGDLVLQNRSRGTEIDESGFSIAMDDHPGNNSSAAFDMRYSENENAIVLDLANSNTTTNRN